MLAFYFNSLVNLSKFTQEVYLGHICWTNSHRMRPYIASMIIFKHLQKANVISITWAVASQGCQFEINHHLKRDLPVRFLSSFLTCQFSLCRVFGTHHLQKCWVSYQICAPPSLQQLPSLKDKRRVYNVQKQPLIKWCPRMIISSSQIFTCRLQLASRFL